MAMKKTNWSFGDSKKDRKGRVIFFIGYSKEVSSRDKPNELWEPEEIFLKRKKILKI
jgi:hypothetical protein|tara:strand:+ start:1071 stop:1241 length:171 start_codon:yes stop_codon:yes gene_type:complete